MCTVQGGSAWRGWRVSESNSAGGQVQLGRSLGVEAVSEPGSTGSEAPVASPRGQGGNKQWLGWVGSLLMLRPPHRQCL